MATPPGALINWVEQRFLKLVGGVVAVNSSGTLEFFETDGVTPKDTCSDPDLATANANPMVLDSDGRPPDPIYLGRGGYLVIVKDVDDNTLYQVVFEETGGTFFAQFAQEQADGARTSPAATRSSPTTIW